MLTWFTVSLRTYVLFDNQGNIEGKQEEKVFPLFCFAKHIKAALICFQPPGGRISQQRGKPTILIFYQLIIIIVIIKLWLIIVQAAGNSCLLLLETVL